MSPDAAAEVFERTSRMIEGYGEEMVRLQGELTAVDAVGPTNHGPGEAAKAEVFLRWLKTLDLLIEREDARDERVAGGLRPNILAYTPEKTPRLWVIGHLDVVPPGEGSLWNADPFTLVRDGDKLFGRGVSDDHQALVMGFFAAKACRELKETEGFVPSLGLGIMAVSDEETGSEFGLKHVLNQRPELFSAEDLIVIPDAGNPRGTLIEVAEKSMLWLKFRVRGRQVHASRPDLGNNALAGGARLILALEELNRLFAEEDPLFDPPRSTFPPTKKEANVPNVNTIPGEDVFYLDCRILPLHEVDRVIEAAREISARVAAETGLTVEVEPTYRKDSAPGTPADAPVVRAIREGVEAVRGLSAEPGGIGGGTVAVFLRRLGLPAAVWMSDPNTAHQPNEFCLLSDMIADTKVLAHILTRAG